MGVAHKFESLGQWHDYWAVVLLSAPNGFREYDDTLRRMVLAADQDAALRNAYETLLSGFGFAKKKLKDDAISRVVRELIEMAFEAYRDGEIKRGNHALQEAEGMIWVGSKLPVKYAVEAERRVFGENVRYKDVRVSPFPYEGSREDLGATQLTLLATAEEHCRSSFSDRREFRNLCWIQLQNGPVELLKAASRNKLVQKLRELAVQPQITGAAISELVISPVSGLVIFTLHERGRPEVSARALTRDWSYGELKFHFDEPSIFVE